MLLVYRLLYLPALLLALPYYAGRMWRRGGYRSGFAERFGFWGKVPEKVSGVKRIWVQAVSVGELLAIEPLLQKVKQDPRMECLITTTTSTGYRLARERYGAFAAVRYFPVDFWPCSSRAWRLAQPDLVLLMESELWPEHLHQAFCRKVPALLINARISDRSFRRYSRFRSLLHPLYSGLHSILASTPQDVERFEKLGWAGNRVRMVGNLKFDIVPEPVLSAEQRQQVKTEMGFAGGDGNIPQILLGSSTWPGEEVALLETLAAARAASLTLRLLIVPRHAERRSEIERLLRQSGWKYHFRSDNPVAESGTEVYVADTTGELRWLTQLADIVFVGKSLPPHHEGQTPIEAVGWAKPLLFGPQMSNFRQIARHLVEDGIARTVDSPSSLTDAVLELLREPALLTAVTTSAGDHYRRNCGASNRVLAEIREILQLSTEPI